MNEFEYINYRIYDLFEEKLDSRVNFQLRTFHNGYRYDPKLDVTKMHWSADKNRNEISLYNVGNLDNTCKSCGEIYGNKEDRKCTITCMYSHIFQHCWEPINTVLDAYFWDEQQDKLTKYAKHCTWHQYVLHSEQSSEIDKLTDQGFKPIHWFANGYLCAEHWYRLYKDINVVTEYKPLQHKFICANRLIDEKRSYRIKFLNMLDVSQGQYSLLEQDPNTHRTPWEIYPDNQVEPHSFDEHDNSSAWINFKNFNTETDQVKPSIWKSSFLHVVPETVVDRIHLTEKIFKPIVLKQPFVLLNGAGSLEYLRSYGFKTFSDFWSEEYDTIDNLDQRLQSAANVVNYVGSCSLSELEQMRDKMKPILEHNYNWFYNGFADKCWAELETNIKSL